MTPPFDDFRISAFGKLTDDMFLVTVIVAHLPSDALGDNRSRCLWFIRDAIREKLERERDKP